MPLDMDRVVELPWAAQQVTDGRPERVLDLASPKLLACWLAERGHGEVVATDVWDDEIRRWQTLVAAVDPSRRRFGRLRLETADATELPYPDAYFDAGVSVSVIEHLADNGDVAAMRELARVLRPGAALVLTLPFGAVAADVCVEHDLYGERYEGAPLFFYRRYTAATLNERLLAGGTFEVKDRVYWRKPAVQPEQISVHRLLPTRLYRLVPTHWEMGRLLSPFLTILGSRGLVPGSPENPETDGVLGVVLRRTGV